MRLLGELVHFSETSIVIYMKEYVYTGPGFHSLGTIIMEIATKAMIT